MINLSECDSRHKTRRVAPDSARCPRCRAWSPRNEVRHRHFWLPDLLGVAIMDLQVGCYICPACPPGERWFTLLPDEFDTPRQYSVSAQERCVFHFIQQINKDLGKGFWKIYATMPKPPKRKRGRPKKRGRPRMDKQKRENRRKVRFARFLLLKRESHPQRDQEPVLRQGTDCPGRGHRPVLTPGSAQAVRGSTSRAVQPLDRFARTGAAETTGDPVRPGVH